MKKPANKKSMSLKRKFATKSTRKQSKFNSLREVKELDSWTDPSISA